MIRHKSVSDQQKSDSGFFIDVGVVRSTKMNRTIVVRRDYLHFVKKYSRCARAWHDGLGFKML